MSLTLTDIDALTLACRDPRSRQYITEAIACHRAGANRAAIVMAWIAVVFDLLHKLKELELASDPEATRLVEVFEKARTQGDVSAALAFERDLVLSIGKFELLSPSELVDIERMREDRNRCGHPSMTTDDDAYQPTPELARTHIVNALQHLLVHPPVQGKTALEKLRVEIDSELFPGTVDGAEARLRAGPFRRPRAALVRNLVQLLLKGLLIAPDYSAKHRGRRAALGAVLRLHAAEAEAEMLRTLERVCPGMADGDLARVVLLCAHVDSAYRCLGTHTQDRLLDHVRVGKLSMAEVATACTIDSLAAEAKVRVSKLTRDEMLAGVTGAFRGKTMLVPRAIALYAECQSYNTANKFATDVIEPLVPHMTRDDAATLIDVIAANSEIYDSHRAPFVAKELLNHYSRVELCSVLNGKGLAKLASAMEEAVDQDLPF